MTINTSMKVSFQQTSLLTHSRLSKILLIRRRRADLSRVISVPRHQNIPPSTAASFPIKMKTPSTEKKAGTGSPSQDEPKSEGHCPRRRKLMSWLKKGQQEQTCAGTWLLTATDELRFCSNIIVQPRDEAMKSAECNFSHQHRVFWMDGAATTQPKGRPGAPDLKTLQALPSFTSLPG